MSQTLGIIGKSETNMRAATQTFDKNINELCMAINDILEKQKKIIASGEKSNREFRQAITNISHDLRTPLTSAIGYIQMIKSENTPDDRKHAYLDIIAHRLKALSGLMNDLFEYTQLAEGSVKQKIEKLNICNVLRDIVSEYYNDFVDKGFIVQADIPDSPVYVLCDAVFLKRTVQNLIQNALAHGVEYFRLALDGNAVVFQNKVLNAGEIDAERLFERFYTADLSRNSNTTGLGLAIVKEIVRTMGCEVSASVENDMLNIGVFMPMKMA